MIRPRYLIGVLIAYGVGAVIGCAACERPKPPDEPDRVWNPSPRDLYNSYTDGSERYTGKTVSVHLIGHSYVISNGDLHWYAGDPKTTPADLVFVLGGSTKPPEDNTRHVDVTGVCRGRVRFEGTKLRDGGRKFFVRVEVSSVAAH